jgi:putative endonuclease
LYVLRCGDGSLYCGITNDLTKRVAAHRAGKGARYTRGRGPLILVRQWRRQGRSHALRSERAFKKLNRREKDQALLRDRFRVA